MIQAAYKNKARFFTMVIAICGLVLCACKDNENEKKPTTLSDSRCDTPIEVNLSEYEFHLPRTELYSFSLKSGEQVTVSPHRDCEITKISDAKGFGGGGISFQVNNGNTYYQRFQDVFTDENFDGEHNTVLHKEKYYYLLNRKIFSVGGGEPLVFYCSGQTKFDYCSTSYIYPKNQKIIVGYRVRYREFEKSGALGVANQKRTEIDNFIRINTGSE